MSIIGVYSNMFWMAVPEGSVTLNGTDNTVGTAQFYPIAGTNLVETILEYEKPASSGSYNEVHSTANIDVPNPNVSLHISFDGTIVSSACNCKASTMNMTAVYCATDAAVAGGLLHMLHMESLVTVG